MKAIQTKLAGAFIIEPTVFGDQRGYFFESYNQRAFEEATGMQLAFRQDNQSRSKYGVLRGLHYQLHPQSQAKLIRVSEGIIMDVVLDIRKGSPTYGQYHTQILSEWNKRQLFVPHGFAHGFITLSEYATIHYKCDNFYAPELEAGVRFDDPSLGIDWQIPKEQIILSEKDAQQPMLAEAANNFEYETQSCNE